MKKEKKERKGLARKILDMGQKVYKKLYEMLVKATKKNKEVTKINKMLLKNQIKKARKIRKNKKQKREMKINFLKNPVLFFYSKLANFIIKNATNEADADYTTANLLLTLLGVMVMLDVKTAWIFSVVVVLKMVNVIIRNDNKGLTDKINRKWYLAWLFYYGSIGAVVIVKKAVKLMGLYNWFWIWTVAWLILLLLSLVYTNPEKYK